MSASSHGSAFSFRCLNDLFDQVTQDTPTLAQLFALQLRPEDSESTATLVLQLQTEAILWRQALTDAGSAEAHTDDPVLNKVVTAMALLRDLQSRGSDASGFRPRGSGDRRTFMQITQASINSAAESIFSMPMFGRPAAAAAAPALPVVPPAHLAQQLDRKSVV